LAVLGACGDAGCAATGTGASNATAITVGILAEVRNRWLI
jgi:hypothetical protein